MSFAATLALIAGLCAWRAVRRGRGRQFAWRACGVMGRQRDCRPVAGVAPRGPRHHAVCRVPFPSHCALWRARQSSRHAGRLRLGDADGHSRRARHAVRLRRRILAANGLRHRMDGRGRALGGEPARRVRPGHLLRHRAALLATAGLLLDRAVEDAAALERRGFSSSLPIVSRRARRCRTCWSPPTDAHSRCAARDGRLAFHHTGGDTFAIREWLAADADGRDVHDRSLGQGIACDAVGLHRASSPTARSSSYVLAPDAFEEDCRRAALIVATRDAPPDCAAMVIGRKLWRERGALALRRDGSGLRRSSRRGRRISTGPGRRAPPRRASADNAPSANRRHPHHSASQPRDATPRARRSRGGSSETAQYRRNSPTSLP